MVPDFITWNSFSWSQIFKILFDIQVSGDVCAVDLLSCSDGLTELCTMRKLLIYLLVAIHYQQLICMAGPIVLHLAVCLLVLGLIRGLLLRGQVNLSIQGEMGGDISI